MHSDIEQRARFEAWARQEPRYFNIARSGENYFYPTVQDAWEVWQAALASQAQVPDGYVLVPREPTDDMLEKANDEKVGGHCYYCSQEYASYGDASRVWAAMIAAAPAPEVSR